MQLLVHITNHENVVDPIMVKQILDSKSRKKNGVTAPAEGLYLVNVEYNNLEESIIEE